jgi:hypothetical protein
MGVHLGEDTSVRVARASPSFQSGDQPIDSEGLNAKRIFLIDRDHKRYVAKSRYWRTSGCVITLSINQYIRWGLRRLPRVICEHSKTLLNFSDSLSMRLLDRLTHLLTHLLLSD